MIANGRLQDQNDIITSENVRNLEEGV